MVSSSSDDVTTVSVAVGYNWLFLISRDLATIMTSCSASLLRNESDSDMELPFPVSKAESLVEERSVGRSLLDWLPRSVNWLW